METALFRIAQESITNIARHSGAKHARFHREPTSIRMVVEDDGRGFQVENTEHQNGETTGTGLAGMRERAALLGGFFQVVSEPGQGTRADKEELGTKSSNCTTARR